MKSVAIPVLAAVLAVASAPAPAGAQDMFPGFVVARVCLPYASRAKTFEGAIRAARDMEFRRPAADRTPLEDWASEVELVSRDGRWRLRIEEGTVERDGAEVYSVSCGVSSSMVGGRSLSAVARRMLGSSPLWTQRAETPWRWDRRTSRSSEYSLSIEVTEAPGERPVLGARGLYY